MGRSIRRESRVEKMSAVFAADTLATAWCGGLIILGVTFFM
jgi:hypothetical protein